MKLTIVLTLIALSSFAAPKASAPQSKNTPQKAPVVEKWLTPARRAQLSAIARRPYITGKRSVDKGMEELRWTNGARSWATTQRVERVLGARATNGWQKKLDAKESEKQAILDDLKAIKDKPTKAGLESIINKHGQKAKATK